jgi:hypothetical protein
VLHLSRAFLVIVNDTIDTTAHGITPLEPSIAGAQQFGHFGHVLHARIEPEIVAVFDGVGSQWPRDCRYLNAANEIGRV